MSAMRSLGARAQGVQGRGERRLNLPKTSHLIADWLRDYIQRSRVEPGEALPSEEELRRRFSASRPTVREAMRILESQQLIRITRGAAGGARYQLPDAEMVAEHMGIYLEARKASQADLTLARLTLEPSIMGFIAESAPVRDIQRLSGSIERQALLIDQQEEFTREHERFYEIVADICQNITLSMFVRILRELMHAQMDLLGNSLMYGGEEARKGRRAHVRGKQKLADLLRERDREGVERWWRRHLKAQLDELVASGRGDVGVRAPRRGD